MILCYEHFTEAGPNYIQKTRHYLQAVAQFYYEKNFVENVIKHYELLLNMANDLKSEGSKDAPNNYVISSWYRRLGEAYYSNQNFEKAEQYLIVNYNSFF